MVGKLPYPSSYYSRFSSGSSSSSPPVRDKSTCYDKVTEFACSACLLCVCCPISMVWCCVRAPSKIGWRLAQKAKCGAAAASCCCGSYQRRVSSAAYSSFSDIDSDDQTSIGRGSCKSLKPSKNRT